MRASLKEVGLVIVGVLLAFGIEAQWSDFRERTEDTGYLRALAFELRSDQEELRQILQFADAADAAADTLRMARRQQIHLDPERLPGLVWRATAVAQLRITATSLESLFRSPAWARMSDPELQMDLAVLDQKLADLEKAGVQASNYWFNSFDPVLRDRIDYGEWEQAYSGPSDLLSSASLEEWSQLLDDRLVVNLLIHTEWLAQEMKSRLHDLTVRIDEIAARLPPE